MNRTMDARKLALDWIEAIRKSINRDDGETSLLESEVEERAETLSKENRALFHEFTRGIMREKYFLEHILHTYANNEPRPRQKDLILLSAYTLLFLTKIPNYAVFSEAKRLARLFKFSELEFKFIHGVLKRIEEHREEILAKRSKFLDELKNGQIPDKAALWSVLGVPPDLVRALTVTDDGMNILEAQKRAMLSILEMRHKPDTVGFIIPGISPQKEYPSLKSNDAPLAVTLAGSSARHDYAVRVSGLASQHLCHEVAKIILERIESAQGNLQKNLQRRKTIRILEMCTGKGSKFLGTIATLDHMKTKGMKFGSIEWWAVDASRKQLDFFKRSVLPVQTKNWPEMRLQVIQCDFKEGTKRLEKEYDIVLLDAPCSGYGTISKLPQIIHKRGERAVYNAGRMAKMQKWLIQKGLSYLVSGGTFAYSVCTMTAAETVDQLKTIKEEHGFVPKLSKTYWPADALKTPGCNEGFFFSIF